MRTTVTRRGPCGPFARTCMPGASPCTSAESLLRHDLHQALVAQAIRPLRRDGDVELVAGGLAVERLLEARDDVALAVQVAERRTAARGVDDGALLVAQGVIERYDAVLRDVQVPPRRPAGAEW